MFSCIPCVVAPLYSFDKKSLEKNSSKTRGISFTTMPIGVGYPATLNTFHSTGGVGIDSANFVLNGPALICTDVILRQEITDIRKILWVWEAPAPSSKTEHIIQIHSLFHFFSVFAL